MTEDEFWTIIDATISDTYEAQCTALNGELNKLKPEGIRAFRLAYNSMLTKAYRWDLWGAAFVIADGRSDDGFDYFCDWLIARGRKVFEAALKDPESLADVEWSDDTEFEDFRYIAGDVYTALTGEEMEFPPYGKAEPDGEPFDEDAVYDQFPRLAERSEEFDWDALFAHDPETEELISHGKPMFTDENAQKFDARLATFVGRKLSAVGAIHNHVALIIDAETENIEARCWTIELADGRVMHAAKYVHDWGDQGIPQEVLQYLQSQPGFDEKEPSAAEEFTGLFQGVEPKPNMDDAVGQATNEALKSGSGKPVITSAKRVGPGSIHLTLEEAPGCVSLTLHGCDKNGSGDVHGVLLKAEGETLCLSRLGVELQLPNTMWGW